MFNGRYTFDSMSVDKDSYVFASEYAVFDWGISTIPRGNIQVSCPSHESIHPLQRMAAHGTASTTPGQCLGYCSKK